MNGPHPAGSRVGIEALADYPERIDVRSPAEFADDHLPGASSHPVLDDSERARVGTLYASSPFAARRIGAALVARHVAAMIEVAFAGNPREWRPLVYCWRGGQRSRALVHIMNEVGWRAAQLDGGYRAWRRQVVAELARLPAQFGFVVVCGLTGSGKSRLLAALRRAGAQVLDLEYIARHRGSLLGDLPGDPQPSQKRFETELLSALQRFDPGQTVFVESESRRIGALQVPDALLASMRSGRGLTLRTPLEQRIALLKREYGHFLADPALFTQRLQRLAVLHGKPAIGRWQTAASAGDWDVLIAELLERHYDPTYTRSLAQSFPPGRQAFFADVPDASEPGFAALASEVLAMVQAEPAIG